jgi:DNA-binding transcriptional regulator YhcF (GntR family)
MQFNPTIPIYLQIMDQIKREVVTGVLARGERIDSVRALAEKFNVNLNTMQRACSELERDQVISTKRGIGSFVTEDDKVIIQIKQQMSAGMVSDFIAGMRSIGFSPDEIVDIVKKEVRS